MQMSATSQNPEKFNDYDGFVEKFKPKKTTDDCYTPQNVYDAVKNWAIREYNLGGREIIRPFWPDGDYEHEEYPEGCVVLDNPPFSILSKICRFYTERGIDYFLFAPSLTLFSTHAGQSKYIVSDTDITYENGATVQTGFVTNLGEFKIHLAPDLREAVKTQNTINTKATVELPKYNYPDHVVNAAILRKIVHRGITLKIKGSDAVFIREMDHQRENKRPFSEAGSCCLIEQPRRKQPRRKQPRREQPRREQPRREQPRTGGNFLSVSNDWRPRLDAWLRRG